MELIKYKVYNGKRNMEFDSDMLEKAILNSRKKPIFRLYGWSPKCVSLGRNQKDNFVSQTNDIDVVRRLTGGRALLHDDEITYSCVFPINSVPNGESVLESYKYISQILIDFFKSYGINLTLGGGRKKPANFDYCMLISTGADVCYEDKKIIGSAQFRKNGYILQHGSILYNYDKNLLQKIFNEDISNNSITCIKEILPDLSKEALIMNLENYLQTYK